MNILGAFLFIILLWPLFVGVPLLLFSFYLNSKLKKNEDNSEQISCLLERIQQLTILLRHCETDLEELKKKSNSKNNINPIFQSIQEQKVDSPINESNINIIEKTPVAGQKSENWIDLSSADLNDVAPVAIDSSKSTKGENLSISEGVSLVIQAEQTEMAKEPILSLEPVTELVPSFEEVPISCKSETAGQVETSDQTDRQSESLDFIPANSDSFGTVPSFKTTVETIEQRENMTTRPVRVIPVVKPISKPSSIAGSEKPKKSPNESGSVQDRMELLIGRKILGWIAVGLFVLAAGFFVQLAISWGWLNLTNRILGLFLFGTVFLGLGRWAWRPAAPLYSVMLTTTGILIFFLNSYYTRNANVFPSQVSTFLLFFSVTGGFLLAAYYRSSTIGLTSILGGLAIPFILNDNSGNIPALTLYLLLLNAAVILLINLLKRTEIAFVAFAGSLILFFIAFPKPAEAKFILSGVVFTVCFFLIYLFDSCLTTYRRDRLVTVEDQLRALLSPIVLFAGIYFLLVGNVQGNVWIESLNTDTCDLYRTIDGPLALGLCFLYSIISCCFVKREKRLGSEFYSLRLSTITVILSYSALAVSIPLIFARSQLSFFWLLIASGLMFRYINESSDLPTKHYKVWGWIFLLLGLIRLYFFDLFPNLYQCRAFADSNLLPFVNSNVFACTVAVLILLSAKFYLVRSEKVKKKTIDESAATENSGANGSVTLTKNESVSQQEINEIVHSFLLNGIIIFWLLACSEITSWLSVFLSKDSIAEAGLWGWAAGKFVSILLAFGILTYAKLKEIRLFGWFILLLTLAKLIFCDLLFHAELFQEQIPTAIGLLKNFTSLDFAVRYGNGHIPMTGCFALTFGITGILLIVAGRFLSRSNSSSKSAFRTPNLKRTVSIFDQSKKLSRQEEQACRILRGIGVGLIWIITSLETVAFFTTRTTDYPQTVFYAGHLLILLWLAYELFFFLGGFIRNIPFFFRKDCKESSLPDVDSTKLDENPGKKTWRYIAYILLILQIPAIILFEFLGGAAKPTSGLPVLNLDTLPVLLLSIFMMAIGVLVARGDSERFELSERLFGRNIGVSGIFLCWLLLSFEIYRSFTGTELFSTSNWNGYIALSVLWTLFVLALLVTGFIVRSFLLRMLGLLFLSCLTGKLLFYEIFFRPAQATPFLNGYTFEVVFISGIAIFFPVFLRTLLIQADDEKFRTDTQLRTIEIWCSRIIALLGVFSLWMGLSIDVVQSVENSSLVKLGKPEFMAQMALSIFWSIFAGILLFVGFIPIPLGRFPNEDEKLSELRRQSGEIQERFKGRRYKVRIALLRWLAIALFGLTTLKVLLVDLTYIDQIYRIAAIFILAVILMLAAGAYHRFKPGRPGY